MQNIKEMKEQKTKLGMYNSEYDYFPVSFEPHKSGTFHIYMFGEISSPQQFINCIEIMRQASEEDTIVLHLQSCGGSIDATDTLLQAMHECQAPIVVRASGGVHSAGTLILLAADTFTLSDNFSSLIHNGSTGAVGKFSDYRAETVFTSRWMEKVLRDAYEGFLTTSEIDDVIKGIDLWLDAEQWIDRHNARNEYIRAKYEEIMAEQDAADNILNLLEDIAPARKDKKVKKPKTAKTTIPEEL